jgi:DNA-binding GntR family transcriptional regulator
VTEGLQHLLAVPEPVTSRIYDHVYATLRRGMASGEIPAGTRLVETELAERLMVSRTPVREALRRLESDGFVQRNRRRGLIVTPMGPDDIGDIGLLRAQVDRLAATPASQRACADDWVRIEQFIEHMDQIAAADGVGSEVFHLAHIELHRTIYRLGFSPRLAGYLENHVLEYIETSGIHYLAPHQEAEVTIAQHRDLLKALASGDSLAAADAAEAHARHATDSTLHATRTGRRTRKITHT